MTQNQQFRQRFAELRRRYDWLEYKLASGQETRRNAIISLKLERGAMRWALQELAAKYPGMVPPRKEDEHDHAERTAREAALPAGVVRAETGEIVAEVRSGAGEAMLPLVETGPGTDSVHRSKP